MCGEKKPLAEFHKRAKARDGLCPWCKDCKTKAARKNYVRNRDKIRQQIKERRKGISTFLNTYKEEKGCADCELSFPFYVLDFDHRDPKIKSDWFRRKKKTKGYVSSMKYFCLNHGYNTMITELAKCDVVCSNCHRKRTYERSREKQD